VFYLFVVDMEKSSKFQTAKVLTVSASHFFHDVYSAFFAPMVPLLIAKFGISLSMVSLLDVTRKLPSFFNPFIGLMADKMCFRYMVILAPAVTAISMSLLGCSPTYGILVILLFISGLSSTLFHIPAPVLMKRFSGKKLATGMSFYMFGGELARTIGPLVITAALSFWGLEKTYRLMPVGVIASVVLYYKLKDIASPQKEAFAEKKQALRQDMRRLAPFFIFTTGFHLFQSGMKSALTLYLPTYLSDKGESLWLAGISLALLQLSGTAGTIGAGYISDKISYKRTLFVISLLSPLLMLLFTFLEGCYAIPMLILIGVVLFATGPVMLTLVQTIKTDRPAFINSLYMTINFGISSIMVFVVGVLGDHLGLKWMYIVSAMLAFLAIPFVFLLPNKNA